eukprot:COSAG01_NODE_40015_length_468_cov_27.577236_1_plen_25_part_10
MLSFTAHVHKNGPCRFTSIVRCATA